MSSHDRSLGREFRADGFPQSWLVLRHFYYDTIYRIMDHRDHVHLLQAAGLPAGGVWADLGAGTDKGALPHTFVGSDDLLALVAPAGIVTTPFGTVTIVGSAEYTETNVSACASPVRLTVAGDGMVAASTCPT